MGTPESTDERDPEALVEQARRVLIARAGQGKPLLYRELAEIIGLEPPGAIRRAGAILEALSADDHRAGRPLLASLVVGRTGIPRAGFFRQARQLGLYQGGEHGPEAEAWFRRELAAAVAHYRRYCCPDTP